MVTFKLAVALEMTENMVHMAYGLLFETFWNDCMWGNHLFGVNSLKFHCIFMQFVTKSIFVSETISLLLSHGRGKEE